MDDRFLRGTHSAFMIYKYLRETGAHEAVSTQNSIGIKGRMTAKKLT